MPTLRLLTYNIRSLRDDARAVSRVIRAAEPHVVCIQEAPRFLRWRMKRAALARRSGLVYAAGERNPANLIMCSLAVEVLADRVVTLSHLSGDIEKHRRGAVLALMTFGGARFGVVGTHLDLEGQARVRHIEEVHDAVDALVPADVPTIIAGDINAVPDSPSWQALTAHRIDAFSVAHSGDGFTYSATKPVRRIDGIFVDRRIAVRTVRVIDSPDVLVASDHRPVLAELELPT